MDAGSEAVDLMVREGLQITEASIKLLAAGSKNLAAFIYALAKDNKRVSGRTNMGRLLREGKELRVFQLRESDLAAFHAYPTRRPAADAPAGKSRCPQGRTAAGADGAGSG